ncbi:hypothetical protein AAF712_013226 [Marasmius tenuissimus]|uniref:RRM domain-containing protein n=1 Tax=Marasmius tenuissimus TaxID=585030 RepID=A0ABR2ZFF0_9AGAR
MARRLYLGKLPTDVRSDEVSKFFETAGRIVDCRVMTGFGFIEFENSKDAEDAVQNFNGKSFMGSSLVVQFAKEGRPRREHYEDRREYNARARRPPGVRIVVSGLSRDTSWQDLKDFGRDAGSVSFADIDRDVPGQGVLEYPSREDAERAVRQLDSTDLRGRPVRVTIDESTIIAVMTVVMTVTVGTIATGSGTTDIATTALATGTTATAVTVQSLLDVVEITKNVVVPLLRGGERMIGDYQGMKTEGTTKGATRRMTASTKGRDTPTGTVDIVKPFLDSERAPSFGELDHGKGKKACSDKSWDSGIGNQLMFATVGFCGPSGIVPYQIRSD